MTTLTQNDNLLIQSYFTVSFLMELKGLDFLNSDYYKSAEFEDKYIQNNMHTIGIDNQGSMLMALYAMLVVPKQLIEHQFPNEFNDLNKVIDTIKSDAKSTYKKDLVSTDYVRHIRNAVAHAKVSFVPNTEVVFLDENNKGEQCTITIPLAKFGIFATALQKVFFKYIETLQLQHSQQLRSYASYSTCHKFIIRTTP